jgi:hypothetical protein
LLFEKGFQFGDRLEIFWSAGGPFEADERGEFDGEALDSVGFSFF